MKPKLSKSTNARAILAGLLPWMRKNLPIVGITSLLSAAAMWATIYYDRPNLQVTIRAGVPEFRAGNSESWSTDRYKTGIDEIIDSGLAYNAADYLQKNRLLVPGGKELVKNRLQNLGKEIGNTKMRIPLYIRVSNNGRRATTIVAGQYVAYEWGKAVWNDQIQNIKEHIGPSEVHDFKVRYLEFDGLKRLPDSLQMDIAFEALSRKMVSLDSELKPPKDFQLGMDLMLSKTQLLMKDITGDATLDVQKGFKIEVKLTDQFDEIVSGVTEAIRLRSLVKLQQQ